MDRELWTNTDLSEFIWRVGENCFYLAYYCTRKSYASLAIAVPITAHGQVANLSVERKLRKSNL